MPLSACRSPSPDLARSRAGTVMTTPGDQTLLTSKLPGGLPSLSLARTAACREAVSNPARPAGATTSRASGNGPATLGTAGVRTMSRERCPGAARETVIDWGWSLLRAQRTNGGMLGRQCRRRSQRTGDGVSRHRSTGSRPASDWLGSGRSSPAGPPVRFRRRPASGSSTLQDVTGSRRRRVHPWPDRAPQVRGRPAAGVQRQRVATDRPRVVASSLGGLPLARCFGVAPTP